MSQLGRMHNDYLSPPEEPASSPESENLWALLEAAGVEESVIEKAVKILDDGMVKAQEYGFDLGKAYEQEFTS